MAPIRDDLLKVCMGCGACAGVDDFAMRDETGFMRPDFPEDYDLKALENFCPAVKLPWIYDSNIWGRCEKAYLGWATDVSTRKNASSGGILTGCLSYLLENNLVDGIVHIGPSPDDPLSSEVYVSTTAADVVARCGSRYVTSSALATVGKLVGKGKTYAIVGRPCEMRALRALTEQRDDYLAAFPYLLSFFCAGAPSKAAVKKLDNHLNPEGKTVRTLKFRGDGWPGFATETFDDGEQSRMSYGKSWGEILGRDVDIYCRFCFDGVGEYADISAGDAWHQNEDGTPNFEERDGRNVVFARTKRGQDVLESAQTKGYLHLDDFNDWSYLDHIQRYQHDRKATLRAKQHVLTLCGKKFKTAEMSELGKYARKLPAKQRLKNMVGLMKRLFTGKIDVY